MQSVPKKRARWLGEWSDAWFETERPQGQRYVYLKMYAGLLGGRTFRDGKGLGSLGIRNTKVMCHLKELRFLSLEEEESLVAS